MVLKAKRLLWQCCDACLTLIACKECARKSMAKQLNRIRKGCQRCNLCQGCRQGYTGYTVYTLGTHWVHTGYTLGTQCRQGYTVQARLPWVHCSLLRLVRSCKDAWLHTCQTPAFKFACCSEFLAADSPDWGSKHPTPAIQAPAT